MHCTGTSSGCSGMQVIYAQLTGGLSAFYIYISICTRSSSGCSGMQGICVQLSGDLDLAVGVAVCKASMLN